MIAYLDQNPEGADGEILPAKDTITWTRPMLKRFKRSYKIAAMKEGREGSFMFDGHEFVVGYAKYLIEYLESRLK